MPPGYGPKPAGCLAARTPLIVRQARRNGKSGRSLANPQLRDLLLAECRQVDERTFVFDQGEQLQSPYIGWIVGARAGVAVGDTKQGASFVDAKLNEWAG